MNRQDIGFPEVANMYRTKKEAFYPTTTYLLPRGDIIPLGEDNAFYKEWMQYNRDALMDKIHNAQQSVKRNLEPRYPQLPKSGTKAQVLFGGSNDDMQTIRENQNKMSGGGLKLSDSTAGTNMDRVEREKQRIRIINRLRKDFESEATVEQPPEARDLSMGREADEKLEFDLLVSSVTERLLNGVIDGFIYKDLLKIAGYITRNVWQFNDIGFFRNLIRSLEMLATFLQSGLEGYDSNELDNVFAIDSIRYAQPSIDLISRTLLYLDENVKGVGRDEKYRKALSRTAVKGFKKTIGDLLPPDPEISMPTDDTRYPPPELQEGQYLTYPSQLQERELPSTSEFIPAPVGGRKYNSKARTRLVRLYK